MSYVLLMLIGLLFVLGPAQAAGLMNTLRNLDQRRRLIYRALGFLAMSAWIEALPSILLTIYLREHHAVAPEIYSMDSVRAALVGIYATPLILTTTLFSAAGAIEALILARSWRLRSSTTLFGLGVATTILVFVWLDSRPRSVVTPARYDKAVLLTVICLVVALYANIALVARFETQLRFYFIPFIAICVVTASILFLSGAVERLVSTELRAFSSGGSSVIVRRGEQTFAGNLVLLTRETIYLEPRWWNAGEGYAQCLVRIPATDSVIVTNAPQIVDPNAIDDCERFRSSSFTGRDPGLPAAGAR